MLHLHPGDGRREQIDLSAFRAARANTAMEVDFWSVAPFLLLAVATIVLGLQRLFSVMAKSATAMGVELNPRKRRTGISPPCLRLGAESFLICGLIFAFAFAWGGAEGNLKLYVFFSA